MGLKAEREKRNFSQSELSKLSGVNVRMIQDYEQGRKDINKAAALTVVKLADALKCDIKKILNPY